MVVMLIAGAHQEPVHVVRAGVRAVRHFVQLWQVCGYLGWPDDQGEGQLIQLEDFNSQGRLDQKLVLVGAMAELFQLNLAQIVQLQLDMQVCNHGHDQVRGGQHRQIVKLKLAQLELD